MTEKRNMDDQL